METTARFIVDAAFCQRATDELYAVILTQDRALVDRLYARFELTRFIGVLRAIGIVVASIGLALVLAVRIADTRAWATQPSWAFIPAFVAAIAVLAFLPRVRATLRSFTYRQADKRSRRHAEKAVRIAQKLAPFEACYDLKGDLLVYTRRRDGSKDGEWQFVWQRKLNPLQARGLAVQATHVTAIFRRATSIAPCIVILHSDSDWLRTGLQDAGIATVGTSTSRYTSSLESM